MTHIQCTSVHNIGEGHFEGYPMSTGMTAPSLRHDAVAYINSDHSIYTCTRRTPRNNAFLKLLFDRKRTSVSVDEWTQSRGLADFIISSASQIRPAVHNMCTRKNANLIPHKSSRAPPVIHRSLQFLLHHLSLPLIAPLSPSPTILFLLYLPTGSLDSLRCRTVSLSGKTILMCVYNAMHEVDIESG